LHKIKHLFKWGAIFKVGNGDNCRFWQDCWLLDVPLKIAYDNIYKMVRDPNAAVADYWDEGEWFVDFRRALSMREFENWEKLHNLLLQITLEPDCNDVVTWALDKNGLYTTKSLYRFLSNRGFPSRITGII
jgi:hypothetical protein